ncbi:hypothetical protein CSC2_49870 [Clostridium zeae]|uniref:Uncharacterized protein n=1 Tax=Clostridium zeae TaxID=2759022 RepID=A0ABQ1EIF3_9CLOT|nr:hypothetical protein [Clostridium zeae]GFZ34461.1 hypothetical protein CSC2_49870 [Clostridium zeae]
MKRDRYIRIPKDYKAVEDYDYGIQKPEQMVEWILSEEEYGRLDKLGVFNLINNECDIIIDDFEEEILPFDKLVNAKNIIDNILKNNKFNDVIEKELLEKFQDIIHFAIERKTLIGFDF